MTTSPASSKPKLMGQVRAIIRLRGMSYRTEQTYCDWIKRFILFHDKRHPQDMGVSESHSIFHFPFEIYQLSFSNLQSSVWQ